MSTNRVPDFYPTRVNMRVPNMAFAADVMINNGLHQHRLDLGAPSASSAAGIGTLVPAGSSVTHTALFPYTFADRYGRVPTLVGGSTTANAVCTVFGFDYLGQTMAAATTLSGTTSRVMSKAFKVISSVVSGSNADAAVISVGWLDRFGLPFKSMALLHSFLNGLSTAAHTLTTPDTSTASVGGSDPRGTLLLNVAADGTKTFSVVLVVDGTNLHGAAHVAS